jgi:hypothetical protein
MLPRGASFGHVRAHTLGHVESDERASEALFAVQPKDDGSAWSWIRHVSVTESDAHKLAIRRLRAVTESSSYADMLDQLDDFHRQIEAVERSLNEDRFLETSEKRSVERGLKAWLSAFSSFDGRTSKWLSREFGKDHPAYNDFKSALSREFDRNFAYRLCCALRNAAEHSGDILNAVQVRSRPPANADAEENQPEADRKSIEGRQPVRELSLEIDGPLLAQSHPKMRSATRAELRSATRPLLVESFVGAAAVSCLHAHATLIVSLGTEIEQAVGLVQALHQEALDADGVAAVLLPAQQLADVRSQTSLTARLNEIDLAELAAENYRESLTVLGGPAPVFTWDDMTAPA